MLCIVLPQLLRRFKICSLIKSKRKQHQSQVIQIFGQKNTSVKLKVYQNVNVNTIYM